MCLSVCSVVTTIKVFHCIASKISLLKCTYVIYLQVFDVRLNNEHLVVRDLDIFGKVGKAMAHDEYIPFTINDGMLEVQGERSPFHGILSIEFVKVCVCVCVCACAHVCICLHVLFCVYVHVHVRISMCVSGLKPGRVIWVIWSTGSHFVWVKRV